MNNFATSFDFNGIPIDLAGRSWFDERELNEFLRGPLRIAPVREVSPMTVGIAVMCDGGKSVVVVSDRMITLNVNGTLIQFDTDCSKMQQLNSGVIAVYSGNNAEEHGIYGKLNNVTSAISVSEIANALKSACRSYRDQFFGEKLEKLGTTLQALGAAALGQSQLSALAVEARKNGLQGSFLIAGADSAAAHIFALNDEQVSPYDDPGFAAIGSGSPTVYPVLAATCVHKGFTLEEAIYRAYEAKRIAESEHGVGKKTQIAVSTVGVGVRFLSESAIDQLATIYENRRHLQDFEKRSIAQAMIRQDEDPSIARPIETVGQITSVPPFAAIGRPVESLELKSD